MKCSAIVLCAGESTRFGAEKTVLSIGGRPAWAVAVAAFAHMDEVSEIVLVVPEDKVATYTRLAPECQVVAGGATRGESVRNALPYVHEDYVLIHDGARPNVHKAVIERVLVALGEADAVVPVIPATDSLIQDGVYVDRDTVRAVQTPQGFKTALLCDCLQKADGGYTDEGSLVAETHPVTFVEGDAANRKLTYPVDYYGLAGQVHAGVGYDIHRLVEGRRLILGGVEIPCDKGLLGHSDGDCVLHAVMDACLSAVGLKDIGHYFPNTERWAGADSADLLAIVMGKLHEQNAALCNVSVAIVCKAPRLAPHIDAMRLRLSALLGVDEASVGISATTNEGVAMRVDDLVTEDAIAAFATVTVRKSV